MTKILLRFGLERDPKRHIPKGPFRTKNSKESKFGTGSKIRYGDKKTLRRLLRNACFPRKRTEKRYGESKTTAVAKYYGFQSRSIFSTGLPCPSFPCFFWKKARKTARKKQGFFYPYRTPKIHGKEGKNAQKNKEFLAGRKNKEFPKKQGKEGQGLGKCTIVDDCAQIARERLALLSPHLRAPFRLSQYE